MRVEFSLENMDMSGFQKGATYPQIKEYVQEHSGLTSICETVQRPAGRYQCPVSNRQSDIQKRMSLFFFVCCKLVSPAQRLSGYPVIYFWGSLWRFCFRFLRCCSFVSPTMPIFYQAMIWYLVSPHGPPKAFVSNYVIFNKSFALFDAIFQLNSIDFCANIC